MGTCVCGNREKAPWRVSITYSSEPGKTTYKNHYLCDDHMPQILMLDGLERVSLEETVYEDEEPGDLAKEEAARLKEEAAVRLLMGWDEHDKSEIVEFYVMELINPAFRY